MLDYERDRRPAGWRSCRSCLDDPTAVDCGRCDTCAGPGSRPSVPDALGAARAPGWRVGVPHRAAGPMADGDGPIGVPVKGRIAQTRRWPARPGPGAAERPRVGPAPARGAARGRSEVPRVAAGRRAGARRVDWARATGRRRRYAVAPPPLARRPRSPRGWRRSVGCRCSGTLDLARRGAHRRARRQQRLPARRGLGAAGRRDPTWRRPWTAYPGPVLLVDDLVSSSRWTLTVAGRALRAGAPAVLPARPRRRRLSAYSGATRASGGIPRPQTRQI
jgi:ATP-dependent DNA helicase RecQ